MNGEAFANIFVLRILNEVVVSRYFFEVDKPFNLHNDQFISPSIFIVGQLANGVILG